MSKLAVILFQFNKSIALLNLLVTIVGIAYLLNYGFAVLPVILLFKLIGYLSSAGIKYLFAGQHFYYYYNAGYSVRRLFMLGIAIDFAVFIAAVMALLVFTHA